MTNTPRTDAHFNEWGCSSEYDIAAKDHAEQLEYELGVAIDAANRSDTIAAERLREICSVADLVLSLADSPLSLMEHLKPWAERHCTLNPEFHAPSKAR